MEQSARQRRKLDKVLKPDITTLKMFADIHELVGGVFGLDTVTEGLRMVCEELIEGRKLWLIVALALISLVALLQELQKHQSVGIGGGHDSLPCLWRWRWWRRFWILTRWRSHPGEVDIR